jgi:hypothetical protein
MTGQRASAKLSIPTVINLRDNSRTENKMEWVLRQSLMAQNIKVIIRMACIMGKENLLKQTETSTSGSSQMVNLKEAEYFTGKKADITKVNSRKELDMAKAFTD